MKNTSTAFTDLHDSICELCLDQGEHSKYCAGSETDLHWDYCKCQDDDPEKLFKEAYVKFIWNKKDIKDELL